MSRFIEEADYQMQIKDEIIRLLTDVDFYNSPKLIRSELTASSQMRNWIGKRYDLDQVFNSEKRDEFIVTMLIDIGLYHLYSQTGARDIPKHRADRYQDAIDWLKEVGKGTVTADLPELENPDGQMYSEARIWSARPPENHKY